MSTIPLISLLTFLPLVGAVALLLLPRDREHLARRVALVISLLVAATTAWVWLRFDPAKGSVQLEEKLLWIPTLNVYYHTGLDGLGLLLIGLTALLVPLAIIASSHEVPRARLHYALILLLHSGLIGAFTTLNFFHWFLFYELSLVPAFFLIRLWGGPARVEAANQFFLYTMVGSVALLLAFLALFLGTGEFGFLELSELARQGALVPKIASTFGLTPVAGATAAMLIFAGIFLGFAVKTPLWPFHTWLPLTYAEASTSTTMLLTGVVSKLGIYGFLRILLPIFPDQMRALSPVLLALAVISIVYSAGAAFAQTDLKRLLGYSSINHLGYCLLGVFAVATASTPNSVTHAVSALNGVLLQIFNHGLTAAALFWFVGVLETRSAGARSLENFGGLRRAAPVLCGLMGIALFSSLGLPGLNGFIGEFLIFKGVFNLVTWAAAVAVLGLLITAVYILTVLERVFYGPPRWSHFPDLTTSERAFAAVPIGLMFLLGLWPQLLIGPVNSTVLSLARALHP